MKRHVVAGMALLALGGCAQERVAQRQGQGYPHPVGLPPEVPPISQTINRGLPPPDASTVVARTGAGANKGPARGRPISPAETTATERPQQPAPAVAGTPAGTPGAMAGTPLVPSETAAAPGSEPVREEAPKSVAAPTDVMPAAVAEVPPSPSPAPAADPAVQPSDSAVVTKASDAEPAATSPAPVAAKEPDAAPSAANPAPVATNPANPEPMVVSSAPAEPAAPSAPPSIPLEVVPGDQLPNTAAAAAPTPETAAPTPETAAERTPVPASGPGEPVMVGTTPDAVSRLTGPPEKAATGERDPLLGKDPDVMPNIELPPQSPDAAVAPASGPAPFPALPPVEETPAPAAGAGGKPRAQAPAGAPAPPQGAAGSDVLPPLPPLEASPAAGRDPLLGANPPVMPDMGEPAALPAVPSAAPVGPLPPVEAPPSPDTPAPAPSPAPALSPAPPPSAASDVMPPIESPPAGAAPSAAPAPNPPAPQAAREEAKTDSAVTPVSAEATTVQSRVTVQSDPNAPGKMEKASTIAARVGDDVITMTELTAAVKERGRKQFAGQRLNPKEIEVFAAVTLADLVDRSLIMQEARRRVKDPKKFQTVVDAADNVFKEHEVPALMRKYRVESEKALKDALIADDSSFERARENFRHRFITGGYIEQQLGSKFKVDLPEKRAYYNAHLKDFDRPAQVTWREVVVETKKSPNRGEALRRAEAILARLRRGEEFAKVAETDSDGPTKKQGGRWQTLPGGYAVESVNRALETLPIGQVSAIIEAPTSYHIVLVEERREAGPARFDEVQDEIQEAVYQQKADAITNAFIQKLRSQAYIRTMFDGTKNDPAVLRATYGKQAQAESK